MMTDSLLYQMALTMIPKIGAITARKLISYLGSPECVFNEKKSTIRKIPGIGDFICKQLSAANYLEKAEEEIRRMEKLKIAYTYYQDDDYPWRLKNCEDGPILLFYKGKPDFNRTKFLSIVGTRNASQYGKEVCRDLIADLSSKYPELVVVSGLAYGIDVSAHRYSLSYGLDTFAVLAHGLHTIYPSVHTQTAIKIMNQGALISDFHSTMNPERNNFLRRNRIIAGLSEATIVIESGKKGGALITAELASSYAREVLAIPGRVNDPYSSGCNYLIKENIAALLESANDVEKLLNWEALNKNSQPKQTVMLTLTSDEHNILKVLEESPGLGLEILSVRTGIAIHILGAKIVQMELNNFISVMPGNLYKAAVCLPK